MRFFIIMFLAIILAESDEDLFPENKSILAKLNKKDEVKNTRK